MSVISPATGPRAKGRTAPGPPDVERMSRTHRAAIVATLALLAWSIVEVIGMGLRHTSGSQLYGVIVAVLAVGAGFLNLALLLSARRRTWAVAGAAVLWAVVALGGIAGVVAHVAWPTTGPYADPRPKPAMAPLAFTAMGAAGGLTIVLALRAGSSRRRAYGKE